MKGAFYAETDVTSCNIGTSTVTMNIKSTYRFGL